jgi:hypothetical protein
MSGLRANLQEFLHLPDRLCVAHGDIDFREVHRRNRIVYLELNSQMRREAAGALARLVLEDIKHLSGSLAAGPAEARKPFTVYIDEAGNCRYKGFVPFISQCRSAGISLVLATQSPLDFNGPDGEQVMLAVVQNTATKLIFCQLDHESAEYCADLGGTRDTVKRTTQMVEASPFGGLMASGVYSDRPAKEYFVHTDVIKALPVGRAYLIQPGGVRLPIQVDYQPTLIDVPFAPVIPRKWRSGDREALRQDIPPLDLLGQVILAAKRRAQGGGK